MIEFIDIKSKSLYCIAFVPRKFYAFMQLCSYSTCFVPPVRSPFPLEYAITYHAMKTFRVA